MNDKPTMAKNKRNDRKNPILRTKEERQLEVRSIINKLNELELTISYEPIKQLYKVLQSYIKDGGKIAINIPFPMINKRIKGLLPDTINDESWLQLSHEKF